VRLTGKKILITQSDAYMGPAIQAFFEAEGAELTAAPGLVLSAMGSTVTRRSTNPLMSLLPTLPTIQ
jgi:hypothetical protein